MPDHDASERSAAKALGEQINRKLKMLQVHPDLHDVQLLDLLTDLPSTAISRKSRLLDTFADLASGWPGQLPVKQTVIIKALLAGLGQYAAFDFESAWQKYTEKAVDNRQEITRRILEDFDLLREQIPSGTVLWRLLEIVSDLLRDDISWSARPGPATLTGMVEIPRGRGHPRVPRKVTVYARQCLHDAGVVARETQTLLLSLVGLYHGRTPDV